MTSCSANQKLRRAARLIREAENAGAKFAADTVYQLVEIPVPEVSIDTMVKVQNWTDTIVVHHDRVTTRVVVNPEKKVVYIASKCDSVTIIKKVPVIVNKEIKVGDSFWRKLGRSALWFLIGLIAGWVVRSLLAMVR